MKRWRTGAAGAHVGRTVGLVLAAASLLLVLAGCSEWRSDVAGDRPLGAGIPDPNYLVTVPLARGDTRRSLERDSGGRVLVWQSGAFAIIGIDDPAAVRLGGGDLGVLADGDGVEANHAGFVAGGMAWMSGKSQVWAGGKSQVWAGGKSQVWAGGKSQVWAGGASELWLDGEYGWMPENTATWQQIRLQEGHALAPNLGDGVKVAVIDTGVDLEHPALSEALAPADEWWDFYGNDPSPQEEGVLGEGGHGHGTNVAGIVRQVAPRATILPLRVLGPDGSGNVGDVAAAISWAVDMDAQVINLSLGTAAKSDAVEAAIRHATSSGVLVVSSTGNAGDSYVTYPAAWSASQELGWQRLSVTSLDGDDNKSVFANYGEQVEMAAPGEDIHGPAPGERQGAWSGTSMSAPMASGALALALAEPLKVPSADLADELRHRAYHDIYNNRNREYQHLLGRGRLDLVELLRNVVDR